MATGLVSATKFGAAAFGGLWGPGRARRGPAGPEGSGGCRGPGWAGRWFLSLSGGGSSDIVLFTERLPSSARQSRHPPAPLDWNPPGVPVPAGAIRLRRRAAKAGGTELASPVFFPRERAPASVCQSEGALPGRGRRRLSEEVGRRRQASGRRLRPGVTAGSGAPRSPPPPPGRASRSVCYAVVNEWGLERMRDAGRSL